MKKFLLACLAIAELLICYKTKAAELTYSDWSMLYPSGMEEKYIESEVRYKWYKIENNNVVYFDDYLVEKDGYIKDEGSARTFYRYPTNSSIILNSKNQVVEDEDKYCVKNFCISMNMPAVTLIDLNEKNNVNNYEDAEIKEYEAVTTPLTLDNISFYIGISIVSLLLLLVGLVLKLKKSKYKSSSFVEFNKI